MMNNWELNIAQEWRLVKEQTLIKAPQKPIDSIWIQTRELLLKAQILLSKYENAKNIDDKYNLSNEYHLTMNMYFSAINGGLN